MRNTAAVVASTLLFAAVLAAAPPATKADRSINLRIPIWVNGGDALTPPELSVKANGRAAKVLRLQSASSDLIILLVLDLAGDLSLVDPARQAMSQAIRQLPANSYVGLLRAQDGLKVLQDPTANRGPVLDAIRDISISGKAGLLDTVETVSQIADSMMGKSKVRVAVLYVTDSLIGNYREDFTNPVVNSSDSRDMSRRFPEGLVKEKIQQLLTGLLKQQAPLFVVHVNRQNDRLNEAYQTGLLELATATGGQAEFSRSVADIPAAIERAFASIVSHQSVEVEVRTGKARQVDLELTAQGRDLRYRTRLMLKGK